MTIAYTAARWTDYGAAAVGAGATLSGLVFVAVSINLSRILGYPSLPARAWQTLGLLVTPMLVGLFLLVPGQSRAVLAWELIVTAVLFGAGRVAIHHRAIRSEKDAPLPLVGRLAGLVSALLPALVSYACLAVGGVTVLAQGGGGLYWLVPSVLLAFSFGLFNAWALLVEIPL
jgi:modulator of FtsH protease